MLTPARTDTHSRPLNPLTRAIGWALTRQADCLQHECGPDSIVVTLAEADIFAVAMTLADERASNDALIAYATGDKMLLTPAVLNGLLHIPGISPAILLESHGGQLVCTRASVDELIRSQARIEKSVSSAAELRDACGVLQAQLPLPGPTRIHRWKNYSGQPYAGKPRTITRSVANEKRPNRILSTKDLRTQLRHIHHTVGRLLGDNSTLSAFSPQEMGPDSGTVLCELLSDVTESRLAAPITAIPHQASDDINFFTHDTGQQETPDQQLLLILCRHLIRPSQPGIFCPGDGLVCSDRSQSFVTGEWPCHTVCILHCRGPPYLIAVHPARAFPSCYSAVFRPEGEPSA